MISVLIPTRNRPETLAVAERSAMSQVVDDHAVEVVVEHDPLGTGLSATINRAARRAKGELLTILPDDDYFVRWDALGGLSATLDLAPGSAAAYSLAQYVDAQGQPIHTPPQLEIWALEHPVVTWASLTGGFWMHGVGLLYRRAWWDRVGEWDESLPCCEEWEYHLRLLAAGASFVAYPEVTVAYRRHATQKSRMRGPLGRQGTIRRGVREAIRARYRNVTPMPAGLTSLPEMVEEVS